MGKSPVVSIVSGNQTIRMRNDDTRRKGYNSRANDHDGKVSVSVGTLRHKHEFDTITTDTRAAG